MAGGRTGKRGCQEGRRKKYAKGMEGSLVKDVVLWQPDTGLGREHRLLFPFEDFFDFFFALFLILVLIR